MRTQRRLVIGEMLAGTVDHIGAFDVQGGDSIGERVEDAGLVHGAGHGEDVVPWDEYEIRDASSAYDALLVGAELEGHVAHFDGHDGWVGDEGVADEIWAAVGSGEVDADVGYVEAGEAVESLVFASRVVVHLVNWERS